MNILTENIISSGKTWCSEFYASIMLHNVYGYFVVFSRSLSWSITHFDPETRDNIVRFQLLTIS